MASFCFYHQKRADGGLRTGLDIENRTVWHNFEPGPVRDEPDPALLWFVDVRGDGTEIPAERDELLAWLLDRVDVVRDGLQKLATHFEVGIDKSEWPYQSVLIDNDQGRLTVVLSAIRRIDDLEISNILQAMADSWRSLIEQAGANVSASRG